LSGLSLSFYVCVDFKVDNRARGKRRGFSPEAAAPHALYLPSKVRLFPSFFFWLRKYCLYFFLILPKPDMDIFTEPRQWTIEQK